MLLINEKLMRQARKCLFSPVLTDGSMKARKLGPFREFKTREEQKRCQQKKASWIPCIW